MGLWAGNPIGCQNKGPKSSTQTPYSAGWKFSIRDTKPKVTKMCQKCHWKVSGFLLTPESSGLAETCQLGWCMAKGWNQIGHTHSIAHSDDRYCLRPQPPLLFTYTLKLGTHYTICTMMQCRQGFDNITSSAYTLGSVYPWQNHVLVPFQLNIMISLMMSWGWAACTADQTTSFPTVGACI